MSRNAQRFLRCLRTRIRNGLETAAAREVDNLNEKHSYDMFFPRAGDYIGVSQGSVGWFNDTWRYDMDNTELVARIGFVASGKFDPESGQTISGDEITETYCGTVDEFDTLDHRDSLNEDREELVCEFFENQIDDAPF